MVNFIDFRKAFDCIQHTSTINVGNPATVVQYGIPEGIVTIIQNSYKDSKSNVKINGMSGEWFEVVTVTDSQAYVKTVPYHLFRLR